MKAMMMQGPKQPLVARDIAVPAPGPDQILLRVEACAVCRTDLHVVDGDLPHPKPAVIPGHEIVGVVVARGTQVVALSVGDRVGVPWLGGTCGQCPFCKSGRENLCDRAVFTGYQLDGGFSQFAVAHQDYCFPLPPSYSSVAAAPLLCAGLIGFRALRMAGEARRIGLYGFGAAAHIVAQVAKFQGREVFAFTRPGDAAAAGFARENGAVWAGGSDEPSPVSLDAALIFAPVGALVPTALKNINKGGTVVCAGIHMTDIPRFDYALLWGERTVRSVANLTRQDGNAFMQLAPRIPIRTSTTTYPLERANEALDDLRAGRVQGAAVLVPEAAS